jgi:hypothetical protein
MRPRSFVAGLLVGLVIASGGAAVAAVTGGDAPVTYVATGGPEVGLRPTGVGLPDIGETGSVGAGELTAGLRTYEESGQYEADLDAVDGAAEEFLDEHLAVNKRKPAMVLDIDETSLSNYTGLAASNFSAAGTALQAATGTGAPIPATVKLYHDAIAHGVSVFFITGRPSQIQGPTEANLRSAGYDEGWAGLYFKPAEADTEQFKSSTRASIEARDYRIIVNVGDQQSDLDGGYALKDFKLPDPFYYIPD